MMGTPDKNFRHFYNKNKEVDLIELVDFPPVFKSPSLQDLLTFYVWRQIFRSQTTIARVIYIFKWPHISQNNPTLPYM